MKNYEFIYERHNTNCGSCVADRQLCKRLPADCLTGGYFRAKPWWKFWAEGTTIKEASK